MPRTSRSAPPSDGPERLIGLISDTHDRAERCRQAVERLKEAGAEAFIHCGDVGQEAVFDVLAGERAWFVWGNMDIDRPPLERYAAELGLKCLGIGGELSFGGRRLYVTHGDDSPKVTSLCELAERGDDPVRTPDFLFTGHTHVPHDRFCGSMRWINPGALHRARPKVASLLDVVSGDLQRFEFE